MREGAAKQKRKKKEARKNIFDIPSPRRGALLLSSLPPFSLNASIPALLSFLFFFFFHYPPAKRIARNLSLSFFPARSLFRDTTSRIEVNEKRRRDRSVSRKRTRLRGSRRRSRAELGPGGSAGEFIFSEARRLVSSLPPPLASRINFIQNRPLARESGSPSLLRRRLPIPPYPALPRPASRTRCTRRARGWQLNGLTTFRVVCSAEQYNLLLGLDLIGRNRDP